MDSDSDLNPPLPQWAGIALHANAGTGWLNVVLQGRAAGASPSSANPEAVQFVAAHFQFASAKAEINSYARGLRIQYPRGSDGLRFAAQFHREDSEVGGLVSLQFRPPSGAVHVGWMLGNLHRTSEFVKLPVVGQFVKMPSPCNLYLSLSNWPNEGITTEGLLPSQRLSTQTHNGYTLRKYSGLRRILASMPGIHQGGTTRCRLC